MNLIEAMNAVTLCNSVVSNANKRYTRGELAPNILGPTAVSFNSLGMTEAERKGVWAVDTIHNERRGVTDCSC